MTTYHWLNLKGIFSSVAILPVGNLKKFTKGRKDLDIKVVFYN